jgi:hypothetical protein
MACIQVTFKASQGVCALALCCAIISSKHQFFIVTVMDVQISLCIRLKGERDHWRVTI